MLVGSKIRALIKLNMPSMIDSNAFSLGGNESVGVKSNDKVQFHAPIIACLGFWRLVDLERVLRS